MVIAVTLVQETHLRTTMAQNFLHLIKIMMVATHEIVRLKGEVLIGIKHAIRLIYWEYMEVLVMGLA